MTPLAIFSVLIGYFIVLIGISFIGTKQSNNALFFKANQSASWVLVAFGMIGASLSGVTFISVPGWVKATHFNYMQTVLGYWFGYMVVAYVLIPVYYKLGVTSIYEYLQQRFGHISHRIGAGFFLLSRITGAAFRIFLVVQTLQYFVFSHWGIPFELTTVFAIVMVWLYTYRGGLHTIIWTDTLQTFCMLAALGIVFYYLLDALDWSFMEFYTSKELSVYHKVFQWDSILKKSYAIKSFIGGMFIAICMTGLDQDMMQKTLSCPTAKTSQKNMLSFSTLLLFVNYVFLLLGALLFIYAQKNGLSIPLFDGKPKTDLLFPKVALETTMPLFASFTFILGLIAAAYSSADRALTTLTTCFCVDFLQIENKSQEQQLIIRKKVHLVMSLVLVLVVILYKHILDASVVSKLLQFATFTYGPLLGLFAFGIFTSYKIKDALVPYVVLIAIVISYVISIYSGTSVFSGYEIGLELLPINGGFCFLGLWLIRKRD